MKGRKRLFNDLITGQVDAPLVYDSLSLMKERRNVTEMSPTDHYRHYRYIVQTSRGIGQQ